MSSSSDEASFNDDEESYTDPSQSAKDDEDEERYQDNNESEEDDNDDDEESYEEVKKPRLRISLSRRGSNGVAKSNGRSKYNDEDEEDDEDEEEEFQMKEESEDDDGDDDESFQEEKKSSSSSKKVKKSPKPDNVKSTTTFSSALKKKKKTAATSAKRKVNGSKKTTKKSTAATKKRPRNSSSTPSKTKTEPKRLKMDKTDRLNHAMRAFCWWDAPDLPQGYQWLTMEHSGVSFPDTYVPHNVKMKYKGKDVDLKPLEEEAATFFAGMDPDGMHLGNPKTGKIFIDNFFKDFKSILGKGHAIKEFKHCDFEPIRQHLDEQKLIKKAITDQEKLVNKNARNEVLLQFGYSLVDGHIERVGNYNMEPPGTFRGRGEHPKMGKLKQRVLPEQVSLNLSEGASIPKCKVPGHAWGHIRHDPQVQWLANWKENINNQDKYMQLAAQSSFKGKSDRSKYNKAALLCDNIDKIRANYKKKLTSKSSSEKQLATAMWVIDRLALRVGGEKDTEEEADTVGCCSLRVEHLHFDPNSEGGDSMEIELEFLGKDSMLYKQTIDFNAAMYNENNGMGTQVYKNFYQFCRRKEPSSDVFEDLTPPMLNNHLKGIMEGLTAKVFRTYNASKTLQDELYKQEKELAGWSRLTPAEKVTEYNNANREVAILCNHQKSVSKAQETQLDNLNEKIKTLKKQRTTLKSIIKLLAEKKTNKIPIKTSQSEVLQKSANAVEKANKMKEKAITNEQKIAATHAAEEAKKLKREAADYKFTQAHLWDKIPTKDQVKKRIELWATKIKTMEMNLKHKDDNKEVALGTSKLNYMDPRISVAWCKRNEVPIEKVFSKTMREKFNWAMAVPPDWEFNADIAS